MAAVLHFFSCGTQTFFSFAGNHADALNQRPVLFPNFLEIVTISVKYFSWRQGFVLWVKGQKGTVLGNPGAVDMITRFHVGNAGQIIFLIHAGVDPRDQAVADDPVFDGLSLIPDLGGCV